MVPMDMSTALLMERFSLWILPREDQRAMVRVRVLVYPLYHLRQHRRRLAEDGDKGDKGEVQFRMSAT